MIIILLLSLYVFVHIATHNKYASTDCKIDNVELLDNNEFRYDISLSNEQEELCTNVTIITDHEVKSINNIKKCYYKNCDFYWKIPPRSKRLQILFLVSYSVIALSSSLLILYYTCWPLCD